ncbi:MAG: D-alanyl-D-alanine carboxypeptidase [Lachnospiraceae bacterium]|nr:D-alanyl-D-alanine carboxypeptidase [Lachnospiraceae bacterium]
MKCINSLKNRIFCTVLSLIVCMTFLCSCGGKKLDVPYTLDSEVTSFNAIAFKDETKINPFASDLCVIVDDIIDEDVDMSLSDAAVLFDINNEEVLYSKHAHTRLHPASLTKVMTAIVALKYGSLDQTLTATDSVIIREKGAQTIGLKTGDKMTLEQALHFLLMYSANDVAVLIAENIGGSVDNFIEMMNDEANALGATNTHFVNSHGLTDDEHYTTAYDLYLIFNQAIKYEKFTEIISMTEYETSYMDKSGNAINKTIKTTNAYLTGAYKAPENVTVMGGKTGTTAAAGHCIILLSKDNAGAPYISVILHSESSESLFSDMTALLDEINKS